MAKTSQELAAAAAGITIEDMGEKVRVHALAKALDVPSAELVQVLTAQGIEGKRATSTLPKAQVGEFLTALTAAGAPAETAKKAPAKRTRKAAPKKAAATKSSAKKAPATKTATKDVPAEDAQVEATAAEKNTDAPAETAKKAPAKRTRKTTAKKAAPKKDEAPQSEAATAEPKKSRARKAPAKKTATTQTAAKKEEPATPETPEAAEPSAEEKPTTKTTSRRPRRGRKATAAAKAAATEDKAGKEDKSDKAGKAEPSVQPTATTTEPSADTVDELIDRIAGSVETPESAPKAEKKAGKKSDKKAAPKTETAEATPAPEAESPRPVRRRVVRRVGSRSAASDAELLRSRKAEQRRAAEAVEQTTGKTDQQAEQAGNSGNSENTENSQDNRASSQDSGNRSQRRGRRGRGRGRGDQDRQNRSDNRNEEVTQASETSETVDRAPETPETPGAPEAPLEPADDHGVPGDLPVLTEGADVVDEPVKLRGSTRLESKKRWRQEQGHDKKKVVSKAEFLARRENVDRSMVVRDSERSDHPGTTTQVGITEDGMLVEHFVTSETQSSIIGNIYLGRVQNVLSSMEAAFVDIGTGRNAVLYSGEVDWRNKHLHTRTRRIEAALKPGDQVLVQAIKDPLGHKGARLTNRLSFAGRYLVYVPGGKTQGISRKLPESERKRLKDILGRVVPDNGGTIIRTAAEGVSEELIAEDVNRLHQRWLDIQDSEEKARARKGSHPVTMYEEPNMLVKVIRDIFNEDFNELVVDGEKSWAVVRDYVHRIAPDLESRVVRYHPEQHGGRDVFEDRQLDEQLAKALSRKVWLPSGGYLIIDRTEAMTVIDVNTGSFVGSGGNLEETVTLNNLEAAEEIVRQMRLRDMGGMIVVDFIDMVLPENRDLMLRRLSEFLGRDRTRHKVSEVTSLGLVQMTRKRLGTGLLETFSTECPTCEGRGVIIHDDPVEHVEEEDDHHHERRDHGHRSEKRQARDQQETRRRHEKSREDAASDHPEKTGQKEAPAKESQDARDARDAKEVKDDKAEVEQQRRSRRTRRGSRAGDLVAEKAPEKAPEQSRPKAESKSESEASPDHSGESQGARRGRRRVVRRNETGQQEELRRDSRGARDDRGSHGSRGAGSAGDVAAIAAEAVQHAGIEDPDEPTGADYVPNEPQEIASTPASTQEVAPEAGTDRRGRRRVRRVVRPAEGHAPEQKAAQQKQPKTQPKAQPKTGTTRSDRKQEPEAAPEAAASTTGAQSTGQSFAEAKAEFDASPRRRRRTRGRSRSDVAPQPVDFAEAGSTTEAASSPERVEKSQPEVEASAPTSRAPKKSQDTAVTSDAPAARRGRRRVVRSSR